MVAPSLKMYGIQSKMGRPSAPMLVTVASTLFVCVYKLFELNHHGNDQSVVTIERLVDLFGHYYEEATNSKDTASQLEFRAMAHALLQYSKTIASPEMVEGIAGFNVNRRIKLLQREMQTLRKSGEPSPA